MNPLNLSREDVEAVQRLRQLYPPHILASLFDNESSSLLTPRESVSSYSSGSARSSVSSSPKNNRNTGASYTSSIPAISERATSPNPYTMQTLTTQFKTPSIHTVSSRRRGLSRSVSDHAIREHALNAGSLPQQGTAPGPVYFCVHCGYGFDKRADWETHEWLFHERQSYWPCPQPGCQAFFDSGKAFEAHHQAVHGCGNCDHAARIVKLLPERKAWACGFKGCKDVYLDWNKRCKHVASHYEGLAKRNSNFRESPEWTYSTTIRNLLRQPELKDQFRKFMSKCHGHSKSNWPTLEWQPDKCAELQRCLEYRDFQRGIPDVIHMAYRLGHPAYAVTLQVSSRPLTPPQDELLSPNPGSVRDARMRSRSVLSTISGTTISPSSPNPMYAPRSVKPYMYERTVSGSGRSELSARISDTPSFFSGKSLPGTPMAMSPPRTRNVSPMRAPSILSDAGSARPSTASRKRMIAREPEVRGTTSRALIDFLNDGPPTAPVPGEHRARRIPRATPLSPSTYDLFLSPEPDNMTFDLEHEKSLVEEEESSKRNHDFDRRNSPLSDYEAMQSLSFDQPVYPVAESLEEHQTPFSAMDHPPSPTYPPPPPPQESGDDIQETVLELRVPTFHAQNLGQKILPPTPGPPPSQSLPLPPPPPPTLSPATPTINFPDTPVSTVINLDQLGEVPPSPMPPGFTDIANWPAPPPSVVPRSPSPPESPERPRTANPMIQPEVIKLMPAPKRSRSSSRGRPRALRWKSISDIMDRPLPSPGVDFGFCLSQPLDTPQTATSPAAVANI